MTWKQMLAYVTKNTIGDEKDRGGLCDVIVLGEGARIMLRKNVDVAKGQYNGALGTVTKVVRNSRMPDGVSAIMVKFDSCPEEDVKVVRARSTYHLKGTIEVKREQFPLSLAYAMTIHKSQGLSLDCVISDLGKSVFTFGMTYVVLSRLRKLTGLFLFEFDEGSVMCDRRAVEEYNRLRATIGMPALEVPEGKARNTLITRQLDLKQLTEEPLAPKVKTARRTKRVVKTTAEQTHADGTVQSKVKRVQVDEVLFSVDDDGNMDIQNVLETPAEQEHADETVRKKVKRVHVDEVFFTVNEDGDADFRQEWEKPDPMQKTSNEIIGQGTVTDINIGWESDDDTSVPTAKCKIPSATFIPMRNTGTDCFAIAALQSLLNCQGNVETWILQDGHRDNIGQLLQPLFIAKRAGRKVNKYFLVADILRRVTEGRRDADIDFGDGNQHDSQEFLLKLLGHSEQLDRMFTVKCTTAFTCETCGLESEGATEITNEWMSLNLRSAYGGTVAFDTLIRDSAIETGIEKECILCANMLAKHRKTVTSELLDGTEYVVLRMGLYEFVGSGANGIRKRVHCDVTGFNPNMVQFGDTTFKVVAAVQYESTSGLCGHYWAYVRIVNDNGVDSWRKCDDHRCTNNVKFATTLRNTAYMILQRVL
jgi:hypothetical protein